jgi:predicted protein tyrosine phosphatase
MPYIENVPRINIINGNHILKPSDSILIQITDPDTFFPTPRYYDRFIKIYQFKFYDILCKTNYNGRLLEPITQEQANCLVEILDNALRQNHNVLVHCTAGLCRSGAVVEVGKIMGFDTVHDGRIPNVDVKSKMLRYLYGEKNYEIN